MPNISVIDAINETVNTCLEIADLPDIPKNRIRILYNLRTTLRSGGTVPSENTRLYTVVEEEIKRLQAESND